MKNLATQNECLLLKLIHRLHHPQDFSWAAWARLRTNLANLQVQGEVYGDHWSSIGSLLPAYRSITRVQVGDGKSTYFSEDVWLTDQPLSAVFPALYSHAIDSQATVKHLLLNGPLSNLQPRLSCAARAELDCLTALVQDVQLQDIANQSTCCFADNTNKLLTSQIYKASSLRGDSSTLHCFVWKNHAPPLVKFFGWLLQKRIQCKQNLLKKHTVDDAQC